MLSWNNAGRKISCDCKKATKTASSDACCVCGVNFKFSFGDYSGKTKYISTGNLFKISEWAGGDKIRLAILLKIHRGAEMDPQNGKSSCERETACFCFRFNTDPPRLEAERRSKSQQSPGKSSEIYAILDWAMKWWMPLPDTQVVIDMLHFDELYCPSTNQVLPLLE